MDNKAFTLIELLVVVLIIGILSAVALPSYQKSVFKARAAQTETWISSAAKAAQVYLLEADTNASMWASWGSDGTINGDSGKLSVDLPTSKDQSCFVDVSWCTWCNPQSGSWHVECRLEEYNVFISASSWNPNQLQCIHVIGDPSGGNYMVEQEYGAEEQLCRALGFKGSGPSYYK